MAEVSGLGQRGNTQLLQVVPDKILVLKTSVNFVLRASFFFLSWWLMAGTSSWQHTKFWEWKFLGSAPSLTGGRLLSPPHEEQRGWERRKEHILSRLAIWMFTSLNATQFLVKRNSFWFNVVSQTGNLAEHIDPQTSTVTVKQQNIKSVNLLHLVKKVKFLLRLPAPEGNASRCCASSSHSSPSLYVQTKYIRHCVLPEFGSLTKHHSSSCVSRFRV